MGFGVGTEVLVALGFGVGDVCGDGGVPCWRFTVTVIVGGFAGASDEENRLRPLLVVSAKPYAPESRTAEVTSALMPLPSRSMVAIPVPTFGALA